MAQAPTQQNAGCGADAGSSNRVVAYLRVSTDRQAEEGLGLDIQQDYITGYLRKCPALKLLRVYRDKGHSGSTLERPALREMLADAKEHRFDKVLVARYDRVVSSPIPILHHILAKGY